MQSDISDSVLSQKFWLSVPGKRSRLCDVALFKKGIFIRPVDHFDGRLIDLKKGRILYCKEVPGKRTLSDVRAELVSVFEVVYLQEDLHARTYEFLLPQLDFPEPDNRDNTDDCSDAVDSIKAVSSSAKDRSTNDRYGSYAVHANKWCEALRDTLGLPECVSKRRRQTHKLLIIANPVAGKKEGLKGYRNFTRILDECEVDYEGLVTLHAGHASQFLRDEKNVSRFGAIVVLAGDGLIYEVINGLYARGSDWKYILQTLSLGVIPMGSGNALARNIEELVPVKETKSSQIERCLLNILRSLPNSHYSQLDLIEVTVGRPSSNSSTNERLDAASDGKQAERVGGQRKRLAFLSIGWGIIADVDIESEHLRMLGEARFTIWGLKLIKERRIIKGRLSYLKSEDYYSADVHNASFSSSSSNNTLIPTDLDSELPAEWTTEINNFIGVYIVNMAYISSDVKLAPEARVNDGHLWLVIVRREATRADLLKIFATVDTGEHVNVRGVEILPIKAFRLEPLTEGSVVTVDGERLDQDPAQGRVPVSGAIQGHILPGAGRILATSGVQKT